MTEITNKIQAGTAEGELDFLDYVVDKGYGTGAAVTPLKSAAKQVFSLVEGGDNLGSIDVRNLDVDDYLDRFETKALGDLKVESIQAYRRRFLRAHEAYIAFLETGRTPSFNTRARGPRTSAPSNGEGEGRQVSLTRREAPTTESRSGETREPMVEYPFPLRSGQVATLRLPVRFEKKDAERLSAFIRALVFEPMLELPAPAGGEEEDA